MRKKKQSAVIEYFRSMDVKAMVLTHPDDDHLSILRIPHHGSVSAVTDTPRLRSHVIFDDLDRLVPPRNAEYLLRLLPPKHREYLIGDLEEEFRTVMVPRYGQLGARLYYWVQTFQCLAPICWKVIKSVPLIAAGCRLVAVIWRVFR